MTPTSSTRSPSAVTGELIRIVRREFVHIGWNGTHGSPHWARVRLNGLAIAERLKVSRRVVELFAFLHDARRIVEWRDPEHGERSARLVHELGARKLDICREEEALLAFACRHHSDGLMHGDATVQACWDADRLDLWRVGIEPDPERLCTHAARDLLRTDATWFRRSHWFARRSKRIVPC